jgi:hypothetical protein
MVWSASNCREDENIFISPCKEKSLSTGYLLKAQQI